MAQKQQYTCIVFVSNYSNAMKYRGVTNVYNLFKNLQGAGYQITAINIYHKQTKQFVKQIRTLHEAYQFLITS